MAVNSYLICEKLNHCFYKKLDKCTTECRIRYVTIYNPQIAMRGNTVYIIVDEQIFPAKDNGEKCLLVVLGMPAQQKLENTVHDVLCVDKEVGLGKLYENLQEIIEYYNAWEDKMAQLLLGSAQLNALCSISVPYFGNPLTVQNENFELIGVGETQDIRYPYNFREGESDYLSDEWVESALNAGFDIFARKGPFAFDYISAHKSLLINVFMDDAFAAQICVDANHEDFVVEDFVRITILAKYVKQYLKYNSSSLSANKSRFSRQLKKYVSGADNLKEIKLALNMKKWEENGKYVCCVMEKANERIKSISFEYFCKKCLDRIPDSVAFPDNKKVFLLINLENDENRYEQTLKLLDAFAEEYGFAAGLSFIFGAFEECRDYFAQAQGVLKLRENRDISERIYEFSSLKLRYVIKYGMDSLPPGTLIPAGLRELMSYDSENNGELFVTLKTYLKNSLNVSETAAELFVHRSTFKYRLEKIRQILGINFEEHDEQIYLQMLLYELEVKDNNGEGQIY